jgi:hypothetical protein
MADELGTRSELEECLILFKPILSRRAFVISWLYFFSCLAFDVSLWKSSAVWLASYILMVLPLGRRLVEILCLFFFIAAIIVWIDILPLRQLAVTAYERFAIRQ